MKQVKSFEMGIEHISVMGRTQNGKTYATVHSLGKCKEGVFFFNTNHSQVPKNFMKADRKNTKEQIVGMLKKGKKINYLPTGELSEWEKELSFLTNHFYRVIERGSGLNIRYAIDETHLFKKEGKNAMIRVVTTGLSKGLKGVFITQRPANMDNNLLTQSDKHIMFKLGNADYQYLHNQGFPVEEIERSINNTPYHFVTFNGSEVTGPFKIS